MAFRLMRRVIFIFSVSILWLIGFSSSVFSAELVTLCYHNIRDDVDAHVDADSTAVGSKQLAEQFEWLKQNNYRPVSVNDLEDARSGRKPLPPRAVLLSFDDGYESFYTRVFPLLKLYNYPAVMALVDAWLDRSNSQHSKNGSLTVKQIQEMQASGLIEFASHSYNLHQGILANPQGNTEPAVVSRLYDPKRQQYETGRQAYQRVLQDFRRSREDIHKLTGVAPRVMVWPYGAWNIPAEDAARSLGYRWFLSLGFNPIQDRLQSNGRIERHMIVSNPSIADFKENLEPYRQSADVIRAAHVDLDYVYDPDPVRQSANLDQLLERIKKLHISAVYLQAFADPDGDGNADAVYFPNSSLPMRADLFNRVAWQLRTRTGVNVYAWMPVLAFDFGKPFYREHGVRQWQPNGSAVVPDSAYRRLSLFDPVAREKIIGLYRDLAAYSSFQGILFHDDALLDMDEDFSPHAIQWFSQHGLNLNTYAQWRNNVEKRKQFTSLKIQALNSFTKTLADSVKVFRPEIYMARNLYAEPVLNAESEQWFAQSLDTALNQYDYVALMAMPWMEKADNPAAWTNALIKKLSTLSSVQKKHLVVELQTRDWRSGKPVDHAAFIQQVQLWKDAGYQQFAWYPDDFHANVPDLNMVFAQLSRQDFPYERK